MEPLEKTPEKLLEPGHFYGYHHHRVYQPIGEIPKNFFMLSYIFKKSFSYLLAYITIVSYIPIQY